MTINDIRPYERNAKKHDKKQVELLAKNIERFGFDQPIVLWRKTNEIIKGHGRYEAAKLLGLTECREATIAKPGDKFIPVEFQDYADEHEANAARLADNQIHDMTGVDMKLVVDDLKDLPDDLLELTGFDSDLVIEPDEADDEVPEVPPEPQSQLGDLYELGQHRVLCGDSTKLEDVERLMAGKKADVVVTDPPYNTGMKGKGSTFDYDWSKDKKGGKARLSHMFNDEIEDWPQFLSDVFTNYIAFSKGECAYYVFIDWRKVQDIRSEMEKHMDVKNVIVWDKVVHGLGSDYKFTYELCVVGKRGKPDIQNRFGLDYQDIWRVQRQIGRNEWHATVKPIELIEKPIKHASKQDDIVLDLFLGSGSTLVASEKLGRACYGMELDPKYIDVIVQRYVDYTGNATIKKNGQEIIWTKTKELTKATAT